MLSRRIKFNMDSQSSMAYIHSMSMMDRNIIRSLAHFSLIFVYHEIQNWTSDIDEVKSVLRRIIMKLNYTKEKVQEKENIYKNEKIYEELKNKFKLFNLEKIKTLKQMGINLNIKQKLTEKEVEESITFMLKNYEETFLIEMSYNDMFLLKCMHEVQDIFKKEEEDVIQMNKKIENVHEEITPEFLKKFFPSGRKRIDILLKECLSISVERNDVIKAFFSSLTRSDDNTIDKKFLGRVPLGQLSPAMKIVIYASLLDEDIETESRNINDTIHKLLGGEEMTKDNKDLLYQILIEGHMTRRTEKKKEKVKEKKPDYPVLPENKTKSNPPQYPHQQYPPQQYPHQHHPHQEYKHQHHPHQEYKHQHHPHQKYKHQQYPHQKYPYQQCSQQQHPTNHFQKHQHRRHPYLRNQNQQQSYYPPKNKWNHQGRNQQHQHSCNVTPQENFQSHPAQTLKYPERNMENEQNNPVVDHIKEDKEKVEENESIPDISLDLLEELGIGDDSMEEEEENKEDEVLTTPKSHE